MDLQARKQALRQSIIAGRSAFSALERKHHSTEITRRINGLVAYRRAQVVLGYLRFGAEFESDGWAAQVLADGKQLLLPRVNKATRQLDLYRVTNLHEQIEVGSYGIREPVPARCVAAVLTDIDFILLPGVAFARDGARLGYGGGFYDKLLARLHHAPVLAAAAFALQLVEDVPQEDTDRKVDWLVTEHEVIDCAAHRARA